MAAEPSSRTLVLSVVAVDLVGYSRESVADQMALKRNFNQVLMGAIANISATDRIILDTGDGVAMGFLGDPEDALYVAMYMHSNVNRDRPAIRVGINLGPVKLATGLGGHPNIIGDGINVAERIMTFADPGQLTASRPFCEVMSGVSSQYKSLFQHIGVRTDKQVRDHEVYLVGKSDGAFRLAEKGVKERASQRIREVAANAPIAATRSSPGASIAPVPTRSVESNAALIDFLENGKKIATTATLLAVIALGLAAMLVYRKTRPAQIDSNVPVIAAVSPMTAGADGGAVTIKPPPAAALAGSKSATGNTSPLKPDLKAAPAVSGAPLVASKTTPEPAVSLVSGKDSPKPVTPTPVDKPPTAAIVPAPMSAPEVPTDAKTARRERDDKSPGQRPTREEIRKAIQARTAEREQSAAAAAAPVIPNLQTPVQAPRPEMVAPTPTLPPLLVARPDTSAVIVERRDPAYPIEGIRQGILRTVVVKARLSIDARGGVTDVVILEGGPIAAFGRQTRMTLKDWKFNPGAPARSVDIEVTFKP